MRLVNQTHSSAHGWIHPICETSSVVGNLFAISKCGPKREIAFGILGKIVWMLLGVGTFILFCLCCCIKEYESDKKPNHKAHDLSQIFPLKLDEGPGWASEVYNNPTT